MNKNDDKDDKLCWMYKGASNHVDKEEYLLGRSVDKNLEQFNNEEQEKKLHTALPKNHVEHECIPPSIRDFNKIVHEQVDLSAKLQEDPLVAIKKQEEEARRQFLQNPIQLKKLQDALKAQEKKKKRKKKKYSDSEDEIDKKLTEKLKYAKGTKIATNLLKREKKESNTNNLDTILMHKFNQFKNKLSQKDIDDILTGRTSDSDSEITKTKVKRKEEDEVLENERKHISAAETGKLELSKYKDRHEKKRDSKKRRRSSEHDSDSKYEEIGNFKMQREHKQKNSKVKGKGRTEDKKLEYKKGESRKIKKNRSSSSSSNSSSSSSNDEKEIKSKEKDVHKRRDNLDEMILEKLRMIRNSKPDISQHKESIEITQNSSFYDSDDEYVPKKKLFGLVQSDGTRLPLKGQVGDTTRKPSKSVETVKAPLTKKIQSKKLSDKEKEKLRNQMMVDAVKRNQERSDNLKHYQQQNTFEENAIESFDNNFIHRELLKGQKNLKDVEARIKSKLNNIQRSSQHMNSNFSKRS